MKKETTGRKNGKSTQEIEIIHCTGKTPVEFEKHMERLEEGYTASPKCYLCGRLAGTETVHIRMNNQNEPLFGMTQSIIPVRRKVGNRVFMFPVCVGCAILLDGEPADDIKLESLSGKQN